jgi:hypothetical protein
LFSLRTAAAVAILPALLLSCGKKPTEINSQAAVRNGPGSTPVDYSPRIGIAVRTSSRTCVGIRNATLKPDSMVTLVVPTQPQTFVEAQISGPSSDACPITQDVAPDVSSYAITLPKSSNIPELSPMIAVIGSAASGSFGVTPAGVQADLDQNQSKDTFRACGANDGIHLTVWRGAPLTGTRVWSGYYYEAGNPGTLPTCSAAEVAATATPQS